MITHELISLHRRQKLSLLKMEFVRHVAHPHPVDVL